jgi:SAM-dependent methyltransferase
MTTLPTKLNLPDLEGVADRTLQHYDQRADTFWEGTRGHDVSQNIAALLQYIEGEPPYTILDLGCGPGRDLKAFAELGHVAIGLDGSARFAAMARDQGYEVWEQNFLKLDLPENRFDGVFANAETRMAITTKDGTTGAIARITISKPGDALWGLRDFLS